MQKSCKVRCVTKIDSNYYQLSSITGIAFKNHVKISTISRYLFSQLHKEGFIRKAFIEVSIGDIEIIISARSSAISTGAHMKIWLFKS